MANHDDVKTHNPYKVMTRSRWQAQLEQMFGMWLQGTCSTTGLQGYLGAYASRWGDDAQTRTIAAALNEWTRTTA